MSVDYRAIARQKLQRAEAEMASGDPERLKYAALELRESMEAITYDRALKYKDELPPEAYQKWQPRRLVELMAELDWMVSFESWEVSIKPHSKPGEPEKPYMSLGTETLLTMKDLIKHYNALGSLLHIPTLRQLQEDKLPETNNIKRQLDECAASVRNVLKSPISKIDVKIVSKLDCLRCGNLVVKRHVLNSTATVEARCVNCNARYVLTPEGNNKVRWKAKRHRIECATPGCDMVTEIWDDKIEPGSGWDCEGCGQDYWFILSLTKRPSDEILGKDDG
jgi:hypothetical protein